MGKQRNAGNRNYTYSELGRMIEELRKLRKWFYRWQVRFPFTRLAVQFDVSNFYISYFADYKELKLENYLRFALLLYFAHQAFSVKEIAKSGYN